MGSAPATALTRKQARFVEAYLTSWNGTRAAREAGFRCPDRAAYRLLRTAAVKEAIEQRLAEAGMRTDEVLARLAQQARLNPAVFFNFKWRAVRNEDDELVLDANGEPAREYVMTGINWDVFERFGYLVKGLKYDRWGRPMIEFYDAQTALVQIGRAHGLFLDRAENTNLNVAVSADELVKAREAARAFEAELLNGPSAEA